MWCGFQTLFVVFNNWRAESITDLFEFQRVFRFCFDLSEFLLSLVLKTFRGFRIVDKTPLENQTWTAQKPLAYYISLLLILPQNFTSLSHPLPLCSDNRTQTAKKPVTHCFSLLNSTTVTSPSPRPPYAMLMWEVMLARKLFVTKKTTLSRGEGGWGIWWFACLQVYALGRVIFL